jgi:hypothetical protein
MGRFQMVDDDDDEEAEEKEVVEEVDDDYHDVADHRDCGRNGGAVVVAAHRLEDQSPRAHYFLSSFRHYNNDNDIDDTHMTNFYTHNNDGIQNDDGILFPYYETRRAAGHHVICGWPWTTIVAVVLLAMLCHAYLPPAPPPTPNMPTSTITFAGSSSSSWHSYEYDNEASSPLVVESSSSDHGVQNGDEENVQPEHQRLREDAEENIIIASSSWRSFLQTHSRQILSSTKALTIDTPLHIFKWLGISLYHDIKSSLSSSSSCTTTWHIPPSIDTVRLDLSARGGVIGQDLAVQLLAEALVGWDNPSTSKKRPLFVAAVGLRSTGKTTLARAVAALYYGNHDNHKNCPLSAQQNQEVVLYIASDDPRTVNQLVYRIQQHIQSYPRASLIIYHDERLERAIRNMMLSGNNNGSDQIHNNNIETTMMSNAIFYRFSHTMGISTLVQHLRTVGSWGSPAMMADFRAELLLHDDDETVILPFAPLTPTVLAAIVQHHLGELSVKVEDDKDDEMSSSSVLSSSSSLLQDVEYMDWTTKQGELILRVALEGARGLPWHRIRALQATTARERRDDDDDHALAASLAEAAATTMPP